MHDRLSVRLRMTSPMCSPAAAAGASSCTETGISPPRCPSDSASADGSATGYPPTEEAAPDAAMREAPARRRGAASRAAPPAASRASAPAVARPRPWPAVSTKSPPEKPRSSATSASSSGRGARPIAFARAR